MHKLFHRDFSLLQQTNILEDKCSWATNWLVEQIADAAQMVKMYISGTFSFFYCCHLVKIFYYTSVHS